MTTTWPCPPYHWTPASRPTAAAAEKAVAVARAENAADHRVAEMAVAAKEDMAVAKEDTGQAQAEPVAQANVATSAGGLEAVVTDPMAAKGKAKAEHEHLTYVSSFRLNTTS